MLDTILVMLLVMPALCVIIITADEVRRLLSRLWALPMNRIGRRTIVCMLIIVAFAGLYALVGPLTLCLSGKRS
jgi:hypothetical protein